MAGATPSCVFCAIAAKSTPDNTLLHSDDKVVAFQDINPSAFRHYLVVPVAHIPTVKDLQRKPDDHSLGKETHAWGPVQIFKFMYVCVQFFIFEFRDWLFYSVNHMLEVGKTLLLRDAPQSQQYRFGFHQPPLNSVNHLHLHCLALPYTPSRWRSIKYLSFGPLGFIEAEKFLEKIKPSSTFQ
ncbi:hypothetical protein VIGAN_10204900 [Vigna angularis var. angularis]|uniref:HIT domain-containing protein n=1 Tax=Vigna angularis var. angularis TaxID=157739 RepID=A0A0S3T678_PHAAN|nr:hypothetical protein VIGAN_10204900 [Vigna angularis var. angularis]